MERNVPLHVGFIMDGNGRWAAARGKSRNYGHLKGVQVLEPLVKRAIDRGIKVVSFYALSTENWSRPQTEVKRLLSLMMSALEKLLPKLIKNELRLKISGDISCLDPRRIKKINSALEKTKDYKKGVVNICFNYGSRSEILSAVNKAVEAGVKLTENDFSSLLYTFDLPDVDMIIRTSGEQRLSNFLLWQSAYAELYFTPVMWPDFTPEEFDKAIEWYCGRDRRFGGTGQKPEKL